jgi:hypothetical protein
MVRNTSDMILQTRGRDVMFSRASFVRETKKKGKKTRIEIEKGEGC